MTVKRTIAFPDPVFVGLDAAADQAGESRSKFVVRAVQDRIARGGFSDAPEGRSPEQGRPRADEPVKTCGNCDVFQRHDACDRKVGEATIARGSMPDLTHETVQTWCGCSTCWPLDEKQGGA